MFNVEIIKIQSKNDLSYNICNLNWFVNTNNIQWSEEWEEAFKEEMKCIIKCVHMLNQINSFVTAIKVEQVKYFSVKAMVRYIECGLCNNYSAKHQQNIFPTCLHYITVFLL